MSNFDESLRKQIVEILDFNTDENTGGFSPELRAYYENRITEVCVAWHAELCKKQSMEWRVEQMRRIKPRMNLQSWEQTMDELAAEAGMDEKPQTSEPVNKEALVNVLVEFMESIEEWESGIEGSPSRSDLEALDAIYDEATGKLDDEYFKPAPSPNTEQVERK